MTCKHSKSHCPLVQELPYADPSLVFQPLANRTFSALLHSAGDPTLSSDTHRYSYIVTQPFKKIQLTEQALTVDEKVVEMQFFDCLRQNASAFTLQHLPDLPPFQGGTLGLLNYELGRYLEPSIAKANDTENDTLAAVGFYDLVHAFDHVQQRAWVFSSGLPMSDPNTRELHARTRLNVYLKSLELPSHINHHQASSLAQSNFTRANYLKVVEQSIDYITAGDIFEVNIAQRFSAPIAKDFDGYGLYQRILKKNPAPFSAYFHLPDQQIISSSPERFIQVNNRQVETRPIKGTRKRNPIASEDLRLAQELIDSEKDHAENVMIVDLMRNDLSRTCKPDSVHVSKLCGHEAFAHVHHLVSVIHGELENKYNAYDLLKTSFPGGSITGAPKIRAMQIISELEPHARGPYCGSLFWSDFSGEHMDSSILIRTYVAQDETLSFHGGGAITIDSCPIEEYDETLDKITALQQALQEAEQ